jgi:hypothetical protein
MPPIPYRTHTDLHGFLGVFTILPEIGYPGYNALPWTHDDWISPTSNVRDPCIMKNTGNAVIEAIENWAAALRAGDIERAMTLAASLPTIGAPLCNHPDFGRVANAMNERMDSRTALEGASWLLMCVAELRAREPDGALARNAPRSEPK